MDSRTNSGTQDTLLWGKQKSAQALGISERKLHSMTKAGEIPCVRFGGRVLYDLRDLRQVIDQCKQRAS